MRTQIKETQAEMTPEQALEILREGNARFQSNLKANRNLLEQVNTTSTGQYPFAVVLSCIDSRTSAELIFDQGLGDVFSVRIAGNVLNDDILGSMEFACMLAGSKLIVVMGHSACGAVKGACAGAELGHLPGHHIAERAKRGRLLPLLRGRPRVRFRFFVQRANPRLGLWSLFSLIHGRPLRQRRFVDTAGSQFPRHIEPIPFIARAAGSQLPFQLAAVAYEAKQHRAMRAHQLLRSVTPNRSVAVDIHAPDRTA